MSLQLALKHLQLMIPIESEFNPQMAAGYQEILKICSQASQVKNLTNHEILTELERRLFAGLEKPASAYIDPDLPICPDCGIAPTCRETISGFEVKCDQCGMYSYYHDELCEAQESWCETVKSRIADKLAKPLPGDVNYQ